MKKQQYGSLLSCMDAVILTGHTKTQDDNVLLFEKSLSAHAHEQVFIVLQVEAEADAAKNLKKECVNTITHALLEAEGDMAERLDSTLKELNGLIKGLLLSKTIEDVHAIVGILGDEGTLHVSHAGRAEAYVVRGGTAAQITEYSRGKPSPAFVHIASGQLEPRDTIVFSTQRLLRTVTPAQLAKLAGTHETLVGDLVSALESEKEQAACIAVHIADQDDDLDKAVDRAKKTPAKRATRTRKKSGGGMAGALAGSLTSSLQKGAKALTSDKSKQVKKHAKNIAGSIKNDLKDPQRKKRAHLLILALLLCVFLLVWAIAHLSTFSQRSQSKTELETLIEQINEDVRTAENRRLTGDLDSANQLLKRAEERTTQLLNDESGLFRTEALELSGLIRTKSEQVNNIVRLSPRTVANLSAAKPSIKALGFIGLPDEEFIAYDRQDLYRIIHNNIDDPDRLSDEELILDGVNFDRYQTNVFQVTGNGIMEIIAGQPASMKTDDPAGWISGTDIKTYLRFLYMLSPENNQIYKYERLSNRYSTPSEYNINGEIQAAIDMTIDGNVYVLNEGGKVIKLLRGEAQPFTMRNLPEGALKNASKIFKVPDGKLYFLDPVRSRVIIVTDGGSAGESAYVRQYVLESDEIGELQDIYVDDEETRLYVIDEKRVYKVDLAAKLGE